MAVIKKHSNSILIIFSVIAVTCLFVLWPKAEATPVPVPVPVPVPAPAPAPLPTLACCINGTCVTFATEADCYQHNGIFIGTSTCVGVNCEIGACCTGHQGSCVEIPHTLCDNQGYIWMGTRYCGEGICEKGCCVTCNEDTGHVDFTWDTYFENCVSAYPGDHTAFFPNTDCNDCTKVFGACFNPFTFICENCKLSDECASPNQWLEGIYCALTGKCVCRDDITGLPVSCENGLTYSECMQKNCPIGSTPYWFVGQTCP